MEKALINNRYWKKQINNIINRIKEYNKLLISTPQSQRERELDSDVKIEISSNYRIKGDEEDRKDVLANLEIYSWSITSEELEVLVEALKMIYTNHPDGEIKMYVTHNHEYLNC
jgi:hypothetical protein